MRQMQQRGNDAGVDATGQSQQHLAIADLRAHARTESSMMLPTLHSASQAQISRTKRSRMRAPCRVWVTSGWNCTP
jgi:hypothetical protein